MNMNDDVINDLKQFIAATVSQQLTQQTEYIRSDMKRLENKIDDISTSVGEALDTANEVVDEQIKDHEARIIKLEHKVA